MRERKRPIAITGPSGRPGNNDAPENASPQPGAIEFVRLLFGVDGAWRYMNTFDGFATAVTEISSDVSDSAVQDVPIDDELKSLGVSIRAVAVPHGMMPSVAFRIQCATESVVFSGDISRLTQAFVNLAHDCSMLVQDFALPEREVPSGNLHAKPSAVGRIAQQSGARSLLLSHFMPPIESELEDAIAITRREYRGKIEVAEDLKTYELS